MKRNDVISSLLDTVRPSILTKPLAFLKILSTCLGKVIGASGKDDAMHVPRLIVATDDEVGAFWLIEMAKGVVGSDFLL